MDKANIQLPASFLVKLILGFFMILILLSFFSDMIPFLSKQPFVGKLLLLMAVLVLADNIAWIMARVGMA